MEKWTHRFGDHVKNATEQIVNFVKWALEQPVFIYQAAKIRDDILNRERERLDLENIPSKF